MLLQPSNKDMKLKIASLTPAPTIAAREKPKALVEQKPVVKADASPQQMEIKEQAPPKKKARKEVPTPAIAEEKKIVRESVIAEKKSIIPPVSTVAAVQEKSAIEQPKRISFSNAPVYPGVTY